MVDQLNEFSDQLNIGNVNVTPSVDKAMEHAQKLRLQADDLERYICANLSFAAVLIKVIWNLVFVFFCAVLVC